MFYSAQRNKLNEGNNVSETKRYFLYARRSMDDDEHQQLSIPAQLDELKAFAVKESLQIIDVFTESKTAKQPGREIFNEMLNRIERGQANGLLSWHPDRLARNAVDAGRIIHLLDTGKLLDLKFPNFWFQNSSQGLFMLSLAFGQSKYYVDALSENTKRGLRQKVRNGIYPGLAPSGYLNDLRTHTIVIDPDKAPTVKKAFELYSTGNRSLEKLAQFLFENGVTTLRSHKVFDGDQVRAILSNPIYYGHFRYNKEIYEGKHTQLISKKLFDTVQEVVLKRGWKRQTRLKRDLPFLGVFRCGECGMGITGEVQTKEYKTTHRTFSYIYYRCTKKRKDVKCFQPFLRQETLTQEINRHLKKFELPESWTDEYLQRLEVEEEDTKQTRRILKKEIQKELHTLNEKIEKILDAHLDNLITRDEYTQKKEIFLSRKKTLEENLIGLSQNLLPWLEPFREWVQRSRNLDKIINDDLNLYSKKEFLKYLGSNFTLKDGKVDGKGGKGWAARSAAPTTREMEPERGIEPPT